MSAMAVIPAIWTGFQGAPGRSTFYCSPPDVDDVTANVRAFFQALQSFIPDVVNIQVAAAGDIIEDTTGVLTGNWAATTPPALVNCTGTGNYAAPSGAVVNWRTQAIVGGRRLRGKTFIVPITSTQLQSDGSLGTTFVVSLESAATALATAILPIRVWHRPVNGAGGSSSPVTSAVVPDMVAVLRSRRD